MPVKDDAFETILGPDAVFKGELTFETAAKVLGKIEGSISSKGSIHIADGSACKATVAAREVAVEGHIQGNVQAAERLDIKSTGRITGDIVAGKMVMADGAAIDGHCRIGVTVPNGVANGTAAKAEATAEPKPVARTAATKR